MSDPLLQKWLSTIFSMPDSAWSSRNRSGELLCSELRFARLRLVSFLREDDALHSDWFTPREEGSVCKAEPDPLGRAHAARDASDMDLTDQTFVVRGIGVRLRSSCNLSVLTVGLDARDRVSGVEVERLVDSWVELDSGSQVPRHWRFDLPAVIELRGAASLFPVRGAPPVKIANEDTRADILAYDGAIHLLFYSKSHALVYFPPDHNCFSPPLRQSLLRAQ